MKTRSGVSPPGPHREDPKPVTPKYGRKLRSRKSRNTKKNRPLKSKTSKAKAPSTVPSAMTSNIDLQFNFDMSSPVRESKSSKSMIQLASRSPFRASPSPAHTFRSPNSSRFVFSYVPTMNPVANTKINKRNTQKAKQKTPRAS